MRTLTQETPISRKIRKFNRTKYRGLNIIEKRKKSLEFKGLFVAAAIIATGGFFLTDKALNPNTNVLFGFRNSLEDYREWETKNIEEKIASTKIYFKENYIPPFVGKLCGGLSFWITYSLYITLPKKKISHRLYLKLMDLARSNDTHLYRKEDVLSIIRAGEELYYKPQEAVKVAKALK